MASSSFVLHTTPRPTLAPMSMPGGAHPPRSLLHRSAPLQIDLGFALAARCRQWLSNRGTPVDAGEGGVQLPQNAGDLLRLGPAAFEAAIAALLLTPAALLRFWTALLHAGELPIYRLNPQPSPSAHSVGFAAGEASTPRATSTYHRPALCLTLSLLDGLNSQQIADACVFVNPRSASRLLTPAVRDAVQGRSTTANHTCRVSLSRGIRTSRG